jgi:hypothetical protein
MNSTTWFPANRLLTLCIAVLLGLGTAGCDEQPLTAEAPSADQPEAQVHLAPETAPFGVLSGRGLTAQRKTNRPGAAASFGLIQGLDAAPNGDVLVADLLAGIGSADAGVEIPLFGVTDASPIGRGALWATVGPVTDEDAGCTAGETTFENCGQALYRVSKGRSRLIANLFDFEAEHNPDGLGVDSNPYDVEALNRGAALVVDAAGNDLLRVDNRGDVDVVAFFPQPAPEAVPTSVAVGPDGAYYVGELTGFPAPVRTSSIWRVAPNARYASCGTSPDCVKVFDGGFTSIIDLAFGPDGDLYVAELDENSWLAVGTPNAAGGTINKCDVDTGTCQTVARKIFFLTAITFDEEGTLWATTDLGTSFAPVVR